MSVLNLAVILGSVRPNRLGLRVARYVAAKCRERGHATTLVDPLDFPLPLLDKMYKEYPPGTAPEVLERLATVVKAADAYVVVSAEYNHSIPPALANLLDHFLGEYSFKPSAIVCYSAGQFGGVRAAMQLRAMLPELGMPTIPTLLPFPKAQEMLDEHGIPSDPPRTDEAAAKFLAELEWYATALRAARAGGVPH